MLKQLLADDTAGARLAWRGKRLHEVGGLKTHGVEVRVAKRSKLADDIGCEG